LTLLAGSGAAAATESEPRLRHRNDGHALSLDRLAEDGRHLRLLADCLCNPVQ
jgi:hypothetical protein